MADARENNVGYFTMSVPDVARGRSFFTHVFGWSYDATPDLDRYSHIAASEPPGGIHAASPTGFTVYFRVADIDGAAQRIREAGGTAAEPAQSATGRYAACSDDQGLTFSLWEPAPGF